MNRAPILPCSSASSPSPSIPASVAAGRRAGTSADLLRGSGFPRPLRRHVMEADQVDVIALAVFRHLQQVEDAEEPGFARQLRSDIRQSDLLDGVPFDRAFLHLVPRAHYHMRTRPDEHAAG